MNTCATCKHWQPFEDSKYLDEEIRKNELGICNGVPNVVGVGDTTAVVEDPNGMGRLRTSAEFTCGLWSAK